MLLEHRKKNLDAPTIASRKNGKKIPTRAWCVNKYTHIIFTIFVGNAAFFFCHEDIEIIRDIDVRNLISMESKKVMLWSLQIMSWKYFNMEYRITPYKYF